MKEGIEAGVNLKTYSITAAERERVRESMLACGVGQYIMIFHLDLYGFWCAWEPTRWIDGWMDWCWARVVVVLFISFSIWINDDWNLLLYMDGYVLRHSPTHSRWLTLHCGFRCIVLPKRWSRGQRPHTSNNRPIFHALICVSQKSFPPECRMFETDGYLTQ